MSVQEEIQRVVVDNRVVLFMKGSRMAPQCGFSARAVDILDEYLEDYRTVDVLADPAVREAIKDFSAWPTIPQLYVDAKFVGGSDIIHEMTKSGELAELLGTPRIEMSEPKVALSKAAEEAFIRFWDVEGDTEEPVVRLTISSNWETARPRPGAAGDSCSSYGRARPGDDASVARRADGVTIDYMERGGNIGFGLSNPAPAHGRPAHRRRAQALDGRRKAPPPDRRATPEEWATAKIEGADARTEILDSLESLDRQKTARLMCHHGMRSQQAYSHLLAQGSATCTTCRRIDARSLQCGPDVPRY
ncbi:MAG: Grx4 family monothiol glutaredoxin [Sandaracinaceae bacterium]